MCTISTTIYYLEELSHVLVSGEVHRVYTNNFGLSIEITFFKFVSLLIIIYAIVHSDTLMFTARSTYTSPSCTAVVGHLRAQSTEVI